MAIRIQPGLTAHSLRPAVERLFELSAKKILAIERGWNPDHGTPVFTARGKYTSRGWTEWTQGFQYGSALLQFEASGEGRFLEIGRENTIRRMAPHVSHFGVHDHGFNNVSTYGTLWRLMGSGKIPENRDERHFLEMALKVSGAVQAARWTPIPDGGFIYSFNGPHSLFIDTVRSLRSLALAHQLGHRLMGERDRAISLLGRLIQHGQATARHAVYYGGGRDAYDIRGRTAHESLFNTNDGGYRCPSTQQGYSPFSTWTRGLAWAICGFAEQLEFLRSRPAGEFKPFGGRAAVAAEFEKAALATADFYIENACACGVPMWDTGAPGLARLEADYLAKPSDPFNAWEPVDSSAAAIAAQGLWRLGVVLGGKSAPATRCRQAALTIAGTLLAEPYLSTRESHQGLLLHSVYHRPNGWDHVPKGQKVPCGESSMWGDYHMRELALLLLRAARGEPHFTFFADAPNPS